MIQEVTGLREGPDGGIGRASILPECPRECLFIHVHLVTNNFRHIYTYITNITLLYIHCYKNTFIHTSYKIHILLWKKESNMKSSLKKLAVK